MGDETPVPEIRLSECGHKLMIGSHSHDLPYSLPRKMIGELVEALAFYGHEANHRSRGGRIPAIWVDNGAKARHFLCSINAISYPAELEDDS